MIAHRQKMRMQRFSSLRAHLLICVFILCHFFINRSISISTRLLACPSSSVSIG